MKPSNVNKTNEKHIKNTVYNYDITNKKLKYKINDLVRISLEYLLQIFVSCIFTSLHKSIILS